MKACKNCWHTIEYAEMPVADAGCTAEDMGKRSYMEDTNVIATLNLGKNGAGFLYGVFDGHGGDQTAKILTQVLPGCIAKALQKVDMNSVFSLTEQVWDSDGNHSSDRIGVFKNRELAEDAMYKRTFEMVKEMYEKSLGYQGEKYFQEEIVPIIKRSLQEGYYIYEPKLPEGHEGHDTGSYESKITETFVFDTMAAQLEIQDAYLQIDRCLYDNHVSAGSTAVVALYVQKTSDLYLINLGDSRAVVWNANDPSTSIVETVDHKPGEKQEKERIEKAGGFVTPFGLPRVGGILAVSRAFGDIYYPPDLQNPIDGLKVLNGEYKGRDAPVSPYPAVETVHIPQGQRFNIVLASDGLWDVYTNEQVREYFQQSKSSACKSIIKDAIERGSKDNITVMHVAIDSDESDIPGVTVSKTASPKQKYVWIIRTEDHGFPSNTFIESVHHDDADEARDAFKALHKQFELDEDIEWSKYYATVNTPTEKILLDRVLVQGSYNGKDVWIVGKENAFDSHGEIMAFGNKDDAYAEFKKLYTEISEDLEDNVKVAYNGHEVTTDDYKFYVLHKYVHM